MKKECQKGAGLESTAHTKAWAAKQLLCNWIPLNSHLTLTYCKCWPGAASCSCFLQQENVDCREVSQISQRGQEEGKAGVQGKYSTVPRAGVTLTLRLSHT